MAVRQLSWAVGKFIYARGGSTPLHFMPLQEFHLDAALDLSLLMSLRAGRIGQSKTLVGDLNLSLWMDRLALSALGDVLLVILARARPSGKTVTVLEQFAGVGLLYELIKFSHARDGIHQPLRYLGYGPAASKQKFELLHRADNASARYIDGGSPLDALTSEKPDVVVVNHNLALRAAEPLTLDFALLERHQGPLVLTTRVTLADAERSRTTITGGKVVLSPLAAVLGRLNQIGSGWRYRLFRGLDGDFFLPEEGEGTGVLIAYNARAPLDLPRFQLG